jgi:hypothetical protein
MPRGEEIIPGLPFVTRKACHAYFRGLRAAAIPGQPLAETEQLRALFRRHPDHEILEGAGILYFTVSFNAWHRRAFKLVRTDGSSALFSLRTCVSGRLSAADQDIRDIDLNAADFT